MESPGQRDRRALLAEAERIRQKVKALKRQLQDRPQDAALREENERLRARYRRIEQQLTEQEGAQAPAVHSPHPPAAPPPPVIDDSLLEHKQIPHRAPVNGRGLPDWETSLRYLVGGVRVLRIGVTSVLILFILAFGYLYFVQDMRFFIVPTRSMQPTLNPMDRILTVAASSYGRGDIVVFPDPEHPGDYLAKRVVAIGGDTVEVTGRILTVNGQPVREPYLPEPMDFGMHPFTVPAGEVFVMGDNRNQSEDSKDWARGVPVAEIRGRVAAIYMPMERFQRIGREAGVFAVVR